jgi:hypothetical protein
LDLKNLICSGGFLQKLQDTRDKLSNTRFPRGLIAKEASPSSSDQRTGSSWPAGIEGLWWPGDPIELRRGRGDEEDLVDVLTEVEGRGRRSDFTEEGGG